MQPSDIARIFAECDKAMAEADTASMSQSRADVTAAKMQINNALNAVESLSTYYDGIVKQYQGLRDGSDDKKRALQRKFDSLKDTYYMLRDEEQRNNI